MTYLLTFFLTIISVHAYANSVTSNGQFDRWWKSNPFKKKGTWLTLIVSSLCCFYQWDNDHKAQLQHDEDERRINGLQCTLDNASNSLDNANSQIARQTELLSAQTITIAEQSRTIGAIAYNTPTTLEGKRRFIRCFRDLTRLTKLNTEGTVFEGLLCDDGVAMYWFKQAPETMTGFHFFSNSELNRVLSGLPTDISTKDGKLNIDSQSELAIALNESLFGKTQSATDNPIEQERVLESIIEEMKILLQYVYRAQSIQIQKVTVCDAQTRQQPFGGIVIAYRYIVDPFADTPIERALPFPTFQFSDAFLCSLCGISRVEFSHRVIEKWRSMRVEPKIKMRDIQILNRIYERKFRQRNFPFVKPCTEDK